MEKKCVFKMTVKEINAEMKAIEKIDYDKATRAQRKRHEMLASEKFWRCSEPPVGYWKSRPGFCQWCEQDHDIVTPLDGSVVCLGCFASLTC